RAENFPHDAEDRHLLLALVAIVESDDEIFERASAPPEDVACLDDLRHFLAVEIERLGETPDDDVDFLHEELAVGRSGMEEERRGAYMEIAAGADPRLFPFERRFRLDQHFKKFFHDNHLSSMSSAKTGRRQRDQFTGCSSASS